MIVIDPVLLNDTPLSRNSPGGLYDRAGNFRTAGPNEARVTYDPLNLNLPPYTLLEEATTNGVESSEYFSSTAWVKTGAITSYGAAVSPRGTLTASKLIAHKVGTYHYMDANVGALKAPMDGTKPITWSMHLKAAEMTKVRIEVYSYPNTQYWVVADIDLTTGVFYYQTTGTGATQTLKAEKLPNGWWRVCQTMLLGSPDTRAYFRITLIDQGNNSSGFVGDSTSGVYIWGAQLEQSDKASSYFPTDPVFVSRDMPGTYYDANLWLQTAAAGVERRTYEPQAPGAPERPLVEWGANNWVRNNTMVGAVKGLLQTGGAIPTNWQFDLSANQFLEVSDVQLDAAGYAYLDVRFYSSNNDRAYAALYFEPTNGTGVATAVNHVWCGSVYFKHVSGERAPSNMLYIRSLTSAGAEVNSYGTEFTPLDSNEPLARGRVNVLTPAMAATASNLTMFYLAQNLPIGGKFDFTIRVGLPCLERNELTMPIKTNNTGVGYRGTDVVTYNLVREADVINPLSGLVYSSVAEPEPLFVQGPNFAKGARVRDAQHIVYESLVDANNFALGDPLKWLPTGPTNRWAALDERNDTVMSDSEEIVMVLSPIDIAQGIYLANVDAHEVHISVSDRRKGVVYRETQKLLVPTSKSSFFNWCFKRIYRRNYFLSLLLPVFAGALVTVKLTKKGGVVKCGTCKLGPTVDVGLSYYGITTEVKDYSTTNFNADGSSVTVKRGHSKRMSVDIEMRKEDVEYAEEQLLRYRQKTVVWVGAAFRGDVILCGKYSSLKKVMESFPLSKMSLQIEGVIS
jgi:hypothetical protein